MSGLHHDELRPRSLRYYTAERPQRLCRKADAIRCCRRHVCFTLESRHSPQEVTRLRAAALRLQTGPTSNKQLQLQYINGDSSSNDTSF